MLWCMFVSSVELLIAVDFPGHNSSIRVSSYIRFGWVKEVKEDVSVAAPTLDNL